MLVATTGHACRAARSHTPPLLSLPAARSSSCPHSALGKRLRKLDKNDDGMVTASELAEAMSEILAVGHSEEEAWSVVYDLDKDGDGVGALRCGVAVLAVSQPSSCRAASPHRVALRWC